MARSRANGPGTRAVIWTQGCDLGCPGCYNPETHSGGGGELREVGELVDWAIAQGAAIDGLTLSGGEPLQQPGPVLALVTAIRDRSDLSIVVFSGYRRAEIERTELGPAILARTDVLIDGRYVAPVHAGVRLRGSNNQRIWCLTDRYTAAEVEATPATEIEIAADGSIRLTGVAPLDPGDL
jgi:anaerobic ribonucleoside-triphosphate reductase activating protein